MTSKQTMAILLASLLASVHCHPLADLLGASRKKNDQGELDLEDHEDLKNLEDTLPNTPEDITDSAYTTAVPEVQAYPLSAFPEDLYDSADVHKVSEVLKGDIKPSQETLEDPEETTELQEVSEGRSHVVGLFLQQLLPIIGAAFFDAVTTVIFNWFYPFKVVPPPPGLLGVSQLWGGLPHPKHWHHHWGHLHQGPGKWGNGNWGPAYWGPAYSRHTPRAPPAHGHWEPHPHAHL